MWKVYIIFNRAVNFPKMGLMKFKDSVQLKNKKKFLNS